MALSFLLAAAETQKYSIKYIQFMSKMLEFKSKTLCSLSGTLKIYNKLENLDYAFD